MKPLKITLVQTSLIWENAEKNIAHYSSLLKSLKKNTTDIILLPEMFSTGFTMNAKEVAEPMNGNSIRWMSDLAKQKNSVVCGSLVIEEKKKFFNRLVWIFPDGTHEQYDKRHLFRMANEHQTYTAGKKRLVVEYKGWRICPMVCYDLRFPVWSRNANEYDLLLYVANWPERRKFAWSQLLIARAIENQCYVAGLNRIGLDGKGISYSGDSVILNPLGAKISTIRSKKSEVETVSLDFKSLQKLREEFPVMMDADKYRIL